MVANQRKRSGLEKRFVKKYFVREKCRLCCIYRLIMYDVYKEVYFS